MFVVGYGNGPSELWLHSGSPRRLRQMEVGSAGHLFDGEGRRMLAWYGDGRAYYLDIEWLKAITDPKGLSTDELVDLACEKLFTTKWFDEAALAQYLDGRPSMVCQNK